MGWSSGGSGSTLLADRWQEAAERLVPAIEELLRRAAGSEPTVQSVRVDGMRARAAVRFPDGIGTGELVARLFQYRGGSRLDIRLEHDRMLAGAGGAPTSTPCYLNDYMTSLTLPIEAETVPEQFRLRVVEGVKHALTAVDRAAARSHVGWGLVGVATRRGVEHQGVWRARERGAVVGAKPGWVDPVPDDEEGPNA